MPCRCSGVKYDKCTCFVASACPISPGTSEGAYILLNQDNESFKFCKTNPKNEIVKTSLIELLYDKCAAYNLRHCPFRRIDDKNSMRLAFKDLGLLVCFLLANFVVFLTILLRLTANVLCVVLSSFGFVLRFLTGKLIDGEKHPRLPPKAPTISLSHLSSVHS